MSSKKFIERQCLDDNIKFEGPPIMSREEAMEKLGCSKSDNLNLYKKDFLLGEFLMLSIAGAFSRNRVYKPNTSVSLKNELKRELKEELNLFIQEYKESVSEEKHFQNIQDLSEKISKKYSRILNAEIFNIGTTQKLLNLYLKYLWSIDIVAKPPHFPVDRIMISEVLKMKGNLSWTKFTTIDEYKSVIDFAKKRCFENKEDLADFEIREFSRRNN